MIQPKLEMDRINHSNVNCAVTVTCWWRFRHWRLALRRCASAEKVLSEPLGGTAQAADRLRTWCVIYAVTGEYIPVYQYACCRSWQRNLIGPDSAGDAGGRLCDHGHTIYSIRSVAPGILHAGYHLVMREGRSSIGVKKVVAKMLFQFKS